MSKVDAQPPDMGSTAISLTIPSESVTASQVQGAPQPQGPLSTPASAKPTKHLMDADASQSYDSYPSIWGIPVVAASAISGEIITQDSRSQTVQLLSKAARSSGTTWLPPIPTEKGIAAWTTQLRKIPFVAASTISGEIITQDSRSQTVQLLSKAARSSGTTWLPPIPTEKGITALSTQIPSLEKNTPFPTLGTHTITANPESQNIFTSGPTLSRDSALTLSSGTSTTVLAPQTSITQPLNASDSLPSLATTMGYLSKDPPFLTTSARTVKADSLGRYSIDSQLLTKSGVITLSRTTISLAPNESAVIVGTSTGVFGPSGTVKFGSGSNGTEVQRFSGNALGARDGLWGSSMMFLVFFMVLLWL